MGSSTLARAVVALTAAITLTAPAVAFAAPANADAIDDYYFFEYLTEKEVKWGKKSDVLKAAKSACDRMTKRGDADKNNYEAFYYLQEDTGLSDDDAATVIEASIYVYCPSVWDLPEPA